jgi:hypothetical protein
MHNNHREPQAFLIWGGLVTYTAGLQPRELHFRPHSGVDGRQRLIFFNKIQVEETYFVMKKIMPVAHILRRLVIKFVFFFDVLVTSYDTCHSCQCSAKSVAAFKWARYDKSLHVLYLDTELTLSPSRSGNLIPWHRSKSFPRYEGANTPRLWTFDSIKSGEFLNCWATTSFSRTLIHKCSKLVGHACVTAGAEAPTQSQRCPGGIYGGQSATGTGFSFSASVLPCQHHSTDVHIHSSVQRMVTAVPSDLLLTPPWEKIVKIDPNKDIADTWTQDTRRRLFISCTLRNVMKRAHS